MKCGQEAGRTLEDPEDGQEVGDPEKQEGVVGH
jgi:hypothetical protein